MDADGAFRAKRLEHVHRFFRADMVAAHQLARAEGTDCDQRQPWPRSEEHTSELQSLVRISYAVFCLEKKNTHRPALTNRFILGRNQVGTPEIITHRALQCLLATTHGKQYKRDYNPNATK